MEATFEFEGDLWEWSSESASWVFVTVPADDTEEIRDLSGPRRGFGSVKVVARVGAVTWSTSIFPSKETGSFVLPVKRSVRDAEGVDIGDSVAVSLTVRVA